MSSQTSAPTAPPQAPGDRQRISNAGLILLVACLAQFMVVLDVAVVNVAIPDMTDALSLSASGQQWVIDAYTLTFGGLLLLCGLATDQTMIEWFRAAQGLGGAILAPTSLSLLTTAFVDPEERHRAISSWAAVSAAEPPRACSSAAC